MKNVGVEIGYAVLAWFVPFAMSVCIFPLREAHRPLFEVIMSFTLTLNTAVLGLIYLRRAVDHRLVRSVGVGLTWMIANWAIDVLMFNTGPMQMPIGQYLSEIAGAYLVIPVITTSLRAAAAFGAVPQSPSACC